MCARHSAPVTVAAGSDGGRIVLRIGINLRDVIVDGDDIYGDGVNVAARLEPLASPGGVCVASIVNESIGSRIDVLFTDGGEETVKNIDRPIRVWYWHSDSDAGSSRSAAAGSGESYAPNSRRSVAAEEPASILLAIRQTTTLGWHVDDIGTVVRFGTFFVAPAARPLFT